MAETTKAGKIVEMAARDSYGRLLAYLVARTGDVDAAEDALAEAFLKALESWPKMGVPDRPAAWLLTTARRRHIDQYRHNQSVGRLVDTLIADAERDAFAPEKEFSLETHFPDERLKLLFLCTHPTIEAGVRTPLMLQTVLGIDAATIANAFLTSPSTMGQRLSRAKMKIRDAGIRLEAPPELELAPRIDSVLDAIYAAYGLGWDRAVVDGADRRWRGLSDESIWLARLTISLLPNDPEAMGLLALMLYCEARTAGRRGPDGEYVPLSDQDASRWSTSMIEEAEALLSTAATARRIGRYQLEAAIQSAHSRRAYGEEVDWMAVAGLYAGLVIVDPTIGARVGQAAAVAKAASASEGLRFLESIDVDAVAAYQPYWALKAHLLQEVGDVDGARGAYQRAIGLSEDPAVQAFLRRRMDPEDAAVDRPT